MRNRVVVLLLGAAAALPAEHRLYTAMVASRGWVAGLPLRPSGVFFKPPSGEWRHVGFSHPFLAAVDYDPRDPSTLYIAGGNGLIRAARHGTEWTILTSHDVTELRDLSVDRRSPDVIWFAHTAGIRVTRDGGRTWRETAQSLPQPYCEAVRTDRARDGRVVAGTADGIWLTGDAGASWSRAGAPGVSIAHLEQSPHQPCRWLAVSERAGIFASDDCGRTFENSSALGVDRNLYDISFDPHAPARVAVCGWGPGVAVSEDGGKTWSLRNRGLPSLDVWSVAFDPDRAGRLWASVHEEALYVSDDAGRNWRRQGLEGSIVYRMRFVPEAAQ